MSPDRWLVLTVRVPSDELRDELAEGLVALGGSAVEEEGRELTTYIPEPTDPEEFVAGAARRLSAIAGTAAEVRWRWQADEDWSVRWKEGLGPRSVGSRIVVTQPWNPVEDAEGRIVIVIEPATAFGTGEHPTTRGALRLLQEELSGGERVLDVGAGSGILAIAAARMGAAEVVAVEADEDALETARENLERNGVADRVRLVHRRVDPDYFAAVREAGFDLVVANVLSSILVPLLPAFAAAIKDQGGIILGGILDTEAGEVTDYAVAAGLDLVRPDREGEWWTGLFRREPVPARPPAGPREGLP